MSAVLRSDCMKRIVILLFLLISLLATHYGQSCGGGKSIFHVYDENGIIEVKDFYINLHIVSEDQGWKVKDFSKYGWKRQIFDQETRKKYEDPKKYREHLETAFEIPPNEAARLIENWIKLSKKYPNEIYAKNKDHCGNWLQESSDTRKMPFSFCTREGCSWMVLAEIQAKGYETANYVSDFICGCTKHYEFRLKPKRDKCLPKCAE